MNIRNPQKKLAVLSALVEGCSIRSIVRMTGVHKTTILRLLVSTGRQCQQMLDERMRGIRCEAIECDELWAYIGKKQRRVTKQEAKTNPDIGDVYTFVALEPDSKAIPIFEVGKRDVETTHRFISGLRRKISGKVQISTDGFTPYSTTIERYFGSEADYAQIVKTYGSDNPAPGRYSPPYVTGVGIKSISGNPKKSRICTSYVERNNLTIRMHQRRFTRLTNAFSRKIENFKASLSIYFWWYNFCKIHGSLRVTPGMALGVTDRIWDLKEVI